MRFLCFIFCVLLAGAALAAPKRVAVLPLQNSAEVSGGEIRYLTNLVRKGAMRTLSADMFTVMTEENMEAMLPPGKTLADCVAKASCAVDIGKEMKAHYVVTGELVRFGKSLRLSVKVHVTQTNGFLEQIDAKGSEIEAFESALETRSGVLFSAIQSHAGGGAPSLGAGGTVSDGVAPKAPNFEVSGAAEAVLRFESTPEKAQVTLNGAVVCSTPCSRTVPQGRHRVSMAEMGYVTKAESVEVSGNTTVRWNLLKNRGRLVLRSSPSGQFVKLDGPGAPIPGPLRTPVELNVPPGRYQVSVGEPKCSKPHTKTIVVKLSETSAGDFQPAVLEAGLKVKVVDGQGNGVEGQLYAGGTLIGTTLKAHKLPVCSRDLQVRVEGHEPVVISPTLTAQKTVSIEVDLSRNPFRAQQRWVGQYSCPQGLTSMALGVKSVKGAQVVARFSFDYRGSSAAQGSFEVSGRFDQERQTLKLVPKRWVVRPPGYRMVGLNGRITRQKGQVVFSGQVESASSTCTSFTTTLKDTGKGLGLPEAEPKSSGFGDAVESGVKFGWSAFTGILKGGAKLIAGEHRKARKRWPSWARKVPPLCALGQSERRAKKRRARTEAQRRARDAMVVALSEMLPRRSLDAVASQRNGEIFAQRKSRLKGRRGKGGKRGGYDMLSLVCVRPGALDNLVRPRDLARLKQMEFEQGAALIRLGNPW